MKGSLGTKIYRKLLGDRLDQDILVERINQCPWNGSREFQDSLISGMGFSLQSEQMPTRRSTHASTSQNYDVLRLLKQ